MALLRCYAIVHHCMFSMDPDHIAPEPWNYKLASNWKPDDVHSKMDPLVLIVSILHRPTTE